MKIGFFTDSYFPQVNGVTTAVSACADALIKQGHQVYIIAPNYPGVVDKKNVIRLFSVKANSHPGVRVAVHLPEKAFLKLLKIDFDIIHGHSGGAVTFLGWEIARLKRIPYICTYHTSWALYRHYFLNGRINAKTIQGITRIFCNLTDHLIAPTEKAKKELRSYQVKKPISVIPSGLDLNRFINIKKGFLRKKLILEKGEPILLYVGRLAREKSVDFLLHAFKIILNAKPYIHFVVIGDGPEMGALRVLAKELQIANHTHFLGFVVQKELPKYIIDADIFLFASQTETQGIAILEAMASGVPVVAVQDSAFQGILNGKNGKLVKRDYVEFAKTTLNLIENEPIRSRMSRNAKQAAQKLSVKSTADSLIILYEELIRKDKKRKSYQFPFFGE